MVAKTILRLVFFGVILGIVFLYDAYQFLDVNKSYIALFDETTVDLDPTEISVIKVAPIAWKNRNDYVYYHYDRSPVPAYEYEEVEHQADDGTWYVCVSNEGELIGGDCDDSGSSDGQRLYGHGFIPELMKFSYVTAFKIHWIVLALLVLGLIKDILSSLGERSKSAPTSKKARDKEAAKILAKAQKLSSKGKHKAVIELLEAQETRTLLGREMETMDLALGKAHLEDGDKEKGLNYLRKYLRTHKEDSEAALELGRYLSEHKNEARIQDLPALLLYIEESEEASSNEEFMNFVSQFVIKHKISDRATIHGLIQVCSTDFASAELRDYVLKHLMQFEMTDELALEFYDSMKKRDPENPQPVVMLAEAKMASGDFDGALDELELLLNLDYENQSVHDKLFKIYQLKEKLNDLYMIYSSILEQIADEPIAVAQQRKIQQDPSFNSDLASSRQNLSLQELLAMRKDGDTSVEQDIMKKYERELTIMFTDIKGYTRMTESQSPLETMQILQESDEILAPLIQKHEGVVIKKIGDAFMARFDSADAAIIASVQIQQSIHKNNLKREEQGKVRWEIRVGLNTGKVIVKDGDVYGDAVNVASRVESSGEANEVFCTEDTRNAVSNKKIQFEARGSKQVKGKAEAIKLFSVVFDPEGDSI